MKKVYKIILAALLFEFFTPLLPIQGQLLYEVSGNSAAAKSYILATNRFVDQSFIDSIPNCYACFSQCGRVVTEFAMQDYEAIAALRQAALLPDSIRLVDCFTPLDYEYIKEACLLLLNLNIDSLSSLKPAYLTALYRDELFSRWLQMDEDRSIATFFEQVASQSDIPVYGLDNAGETMYISFDREPLAWQCQELKHLIDYPEKEVNQAQVLKEHYLNGHLMDIVYQVEGPDNETTVSYSDYKVFCQRNKQWVKRLTPYFKDGRTFVTLDAIYLGGDEGLLAQLKAVGFRVRPVKKSLKHNT